MNAKRNYNSEQIVEIGKRIRARREALHLSQRQLADKINAEKNIIQRIESGKLKTVNVNRIVYIATMLDCNINYLLLQSEDPRTTHSDTPPHYTAPEFQFTAEGFLFSHPTLANDFTYISKYMHEDFQKQIIELIHTIVTFHKCGVKFPDVEPAKAATKTMKECNQELEDNFWDNNSKSQWRLPRPTVP